MVYNKVIHFLDVESLTYYLHMLKFTRFIEYPIEMEITTMQMKTNMLFYSYL